MDTGINRHKSKDRLTIKSIEAAYPSRTLPSKAKVTRIAPSPTGFAHLGFIYMSLISKQIAIDTDGVFIFRLEDTDQNREVEGADVLLRDALEVFGIEYDEGVESNGMSKGKYGPYRQTERVRIYQAYVEDLISKGLAYRCFMSAEELNAEGIPILERVLLSSKDCSVLNFGMVIFTRLDSIAEVILLRASAESFFSTSASALPFSGSRTTMEKRPFL